MAKDPAENFESVVDYTTVLENFEGPLDLLLFLIKQEKIEIKDIFVSKVTEQFLEYMKGLPYIDIDKASEYLAIASTILEIKARIKAIMRRSSKSRKYRKEEKKESVIAAGDLQLDTESRRVNIAGKEINLTAKEFDLLELLVRNPNKVYSREALLTYVWGNRALENGDVRTVDVHVRRLREKIEPSPSDPKYVHTKWGVGYYFRVKNP